MEARARELLEFVDVENLQDYRRLASGLLGWVAFQKGDLGTGLGAMRDAVGPWRAVAALVDRRRRAL